MSNPVDYDSISLKTPAEIAMLRAAGGIAAQVLQDLTPYIKPGTTSRRINDIAHDLIVDKYGAEIDREDLSGYDSSEYAAISIAHNEVAFSGEPSGIPLKKGDLFGVDVSIKKNGWCGDTQRMWIVGEETTAEARMLATVGYQAMCLGISLVRPGARLQEIARQVQAYVESFGFSMLRVDSATGHSIGQVHADGWLIPYYEDERNEGRVLQKGMVITVEPFLCAGSGEGMRLPDATRSAVTADSSLAVYWEHVVAVTDSGCEVLDLREGEDVTFYDHRRPS
ncbi:M24 family metallopeptidase [Streptomyces noursei]|uniref:M24 family metallopeptidase n=1 Tax=Streptomyces noursei TaxID=1971 RepID=UPI0016777D0A|nr:M24 family metallopeptidase [Streptomyces noursei]MCZ1012885.1 M24 family metallopeptidase [Streptomyces noursei]GGX20754.1 methionine aminopeptidase [Streptomyces noursei]